ncbi:MAG TPA: DUF456 domain-containing protein [Candidatus Paceibacterota bacterium]|jgi:uncharacterized protein YqgC (DUF456 family)|nr:DUF456 domain-containing protein [Candidatus Paceibacterota bacterium]
MTITLIIIAALLMLPGIISIAFMLPGIPYLFIVALIYGFIDHFTRLSLKELLILGIIAICSVIIDQLAGILGAHYGGARGKTFLYGIAGAIIGTIIFPLFGGFVGLFAGIVIGELMRKQSHSHAIKAATVGVIGTITGIIINIILAIAFLILFLVFVI